MITYERVRELFNYDDGLLRWKMKPRKTSSVVVGSIAGSVRNTDGRRRIRVDRKFYYSYQLIYLYFHRVIPGYIDHVNGDTGDDRIHNLRECNMSQNNMNSVTPKHNKSGAKNVHWSSRNKKWIVKLKVNKINKHIGCFDDFELAELVASEAREKYHGPFICRR